MRNNDLFNTLRSLDAAPRASSNEAFRQKAGARLEEILTTSPLGKHPSPRRPSPGRRTTTSRWWALPVVAVVAIGALVIVPTATRPDPAYASWTPIPSTLPQSERAIAVAACLDSSSDVESAKPRLAERRGEWVGVVVTGQTDDEPVTVHCLMHLPAGGNHAGSVTSGTSGGQGAIPVGDQFTDGSISQFSGGGGLFNFEAQPTISFNVGDVGSDVAAVTIVDVDGETVRATVDDGRFFAWWPGRAFRNKTEGSGGPAPALTYRLALRDGTVIDDAQPTLPE